MKISVIIPTYNEEDVIKGCLQSLETQSIKDFEVIIIDDGSTDKTNKIVSEHKGEKYKLIHKKQLHKGSGAARNCGSKKAVGEILVFVDADMTFDKNFLKKLVEPIIKGTTKGTFSKEEYVSNWNNVWARCWNINEGRQEKRRHPKNYPDKQKVFRAILESEFKRVGGFTPGGYDDDWSLSKKLGYEADVAGGAKFFHKNPSSLQEVFLQARWVGKRKYKLGIIGGVVAVVRASFLFSFFFGTLKSLIWKEPFFLVFKVVYDLGICFGIITYVFGKEGSK